MFKAYQYATNETKPLLGLGMWMWKKFKLVYIKPLPRPKSLGKGGKTVSRLILKVKLT